MRYSRKLMWKYPPLTLVIKKKKPQEEEEVLTQPQEEEEEVLTQPQNGINSTVSFSTTA